jgi:predicted DNA-binding transcriptional regulator AlpA
MTLQTDRYVDMRQIAELAGVKVQTIRKYRCRGLLPEPDAVFGRTPIWLRTTVEAWLLTRRGPGRPPELTRPRTRPLKRAEPPADV